MPPARKFLTVIFSQLFKRCLPLVLWAFCAASPAIAQQGTGASVLSDDVTKFPELGAELPPGQGDPLPDQPAAVKTPPPLQTVDLDMIFLSAAGGDRGAMNITIGELVRQVLANNPDIKAQRLQPELGETDVRRALGAFDPTVKFSGQYSQSALPQNAQEYIATGGETTETQMALIDQLQSLQVSLDNLLAEIEGKPVTTNGSSASRSAFTDPRIFSSNQYLMLWQVGGVTPIGTQYSFGLSQSQARNDLNSQIPPSLFYPETTTTMSFNLTQPLLKNFGPAANLAAVRVSRLQRRIGWYEWKQMMIQSLSTALSGYFDLVYARENLVVRQQAVAASKLLETRNIRRAESGKMRPSDVWEAQTALSNNVDIALRAINAYVDAQNALKLLIFSEKMLLSNRLGVLIPAESIDVPSVRIDRAKFLAEAFSKRPEYLNIIAKAEQEGIRVRYARNQTLPKVDVQASYGLTGLEQDYGNSFANSVDGQGTQFMVGVTVSVPLGNIEARAALDAAKLREKQTMLAIQKSGMAISIEIDTVISLLETTRQQVRTAHDTSVAARKTADIEQKLLEEGKSTTFEVVRLQNNAADARSRELAAIATYRKNVLRLAVARGILLDELGISLEKEAWRDVRRTSPRTKDLNEFLDDKPVLP